MLVVVVNVYDQPLSLRFSSIYHLLLQSQQTTKQVRELQAGYVSLGSLTVNARSLRYRDGFEGDYIMSTGLKGGSTGYQMENGYGFH